MTLTKDDIDRIKESKQACDEVWTRDGGWYGGLDYFNLANSASNLLDWSKRAAELLTKASWSCMPGLKDDIETLLDEVTFTAGRKMSKSNWQIPE